MSDGVSFDPTIVLRPRSLDETIDLALAYLRANRRDFLRIIFAVGAFGFALAMALRLGFGLGWGTIWCVTFVTVPFFERAVVVYAGNHLFQNHWSFRRSLLRVIKRPFYGVITALLIPLPWLGMFVTDFDEVWIGAGILLGVFWPFALAWFLYVSITVMLENVSARKGRKRASSLITYRYGRALFFVIQATLVRIFAVYLGEVSVQLVTKLFLSGPGPFETVQTSGGSFVAIATYFGIAPVVAVCRLFDYVDARTQLEGWDIQVRFNGLKAKAKKEREGRLAA